MTKRLIERVKSIAAQGGITEAKLEPYLQVFKRDVEQYQRDRIIMQERSNELYGLLDFLYKTKGSVIELRGVIRNPQKGEVKGTEKRMKIELGRYYYLLEDGLEYECELFGFIKGCKNFVEIFFMDLYLSLSKVDIPKRTKLALIYDSCIIGGVIEGVYIEGLKGEVGRAKSDYIRNKINSFNNKEVGINLLERGYNMGLVSEEVYREYAAKEINRRKLKI